MFSEALNYQPVTYTSSGLISLQIGGANEIDLVAETKDHILKIPLLHSAEATSDESLTTTLATTVERGHLLKIEEEK